MQHYLIGFYIDRNDNSRTYVHVRASTVKALNQYVRSLPIAPMGRCFIRMRSQHVLNDYKLQELADSFIERVKKQLKLTPFDINQICDTDYKLVK